MLRCLQAARWPTQHPTPAWSTHRPDESRSFESKRSLGTAKISTRIVATISPTSRPSMEHWRSHNVRLSATQLMRQHQGASTARRGGRDNSRVPMARSDWTCSAADVLRCDHARAPARRRAIFRPIGRPSASARARRVSNTLTGSFDHIDTFGRIPRSELIRMVGARRATNMLHSPAERERFPSTNLKDWGHWAACSGFGAFYGATFENSICPEFESFD